MAASSTVCHVRGENPCITYAHRDALCLLVLQVFWRVVGYKVVHTKSAAGLFYACALSQSDCAGSLRFTTYRMVALQGTDTRDREIEYSRDWVKYSAPLGRIAYCCVEHRSTMVYLDNGPYGRYAKSLTDLKDFIGSDPRFFSTGRWIVNQNYIEELEDSFSRKKFIVLRFPFQAKLSLPKEKVSEFRQWFDGVNQSNTPL